MPKKILIFSLAYYPDYVGGAEVAIKEITDNISKDESSFDMVTAKMNFSQKRFERIGNINVYRVGLGHPVLDKFLIPIFGLLKAVSLNKSNNYDLSWVMMANQASVAASFFKIIKRKIPLILTIQEGDEEEHLKRYVFGNKFLYRLFIRPWHLLIFKLADRSTAISTYLKERIKSNKFKGPIDIIPNGANFKNFSKKYSEDELLELRNSLGFKSTDKVIVTTSRFVKKNANEDIISSLKYLPQKYKVLFIGTGPDLYKLQNLAEKENVYDRIIFLGYTHTSEVPKYLKISDVFVRPSLSEGQGVSFMEAMVAGIPIVATPVGGIPDFLIDRKTGLFCEIKNPENIALQVKLLEKDQILRDSIIQNARELSKDYKWELLALKMLEVFENSPVISRRILIVTGDRGGPVTYSNILNNRLIEWGFKTKVLSFAEIRYLSKVFGRFVFMTKLKWRALSSDTVYAQDPVSVGLPAVLVAKFIRKKFALKIVGDYAWEQGLQRFGVTDSLDDFSLSNDYSFKVRFFKRVQRFVASTADIIIVPSFYLKRIVSNWGIDEDKINVVHNSFKGFSLRDKTTLREELNFGNKKVIISSGRMVPWKGLDTLLDTVAEIPNVTIILADDGPEKDKLKKKANTLKLKGRVKFIGKVSHQKLLEYIKASDLFVLNSSYEGFSHVLLEAMSVGTPIVATNVGGNPELITNNQDGILVENGNKEELFKAISRVLMDEILSRKLRGNGLKRIKAFSEDIMLDKLTKIL
jgi:glycosyltransferase involved in cell wall biosynthesis